MAKFRLVLDQLQVESFRVSTGKTQAGTVYGRDEMIAGEMAIGPGTDAGDTCYATCYGKYTCQGQTMCETTCYASAPHICCALGM